MSEPDAVAARYARRAVGDRYSPLNADVWQSQHERRRVLVALLRRHAARRPGEMNVLDVGCGAGDALLELLLLGFDPARLAGSELLPERAASARRRLPAEVRVLTGDALALAQPEGPLPDEHFDLVLQNTVFSSLLDDDFQARLAQRMWRWTKRGGAVVWYDFTVNNPRNADVRGVPLARIRALFPQGRIDARRVTLAPPVARRVAAWHPAAWRVFNALPLLRTHLLCWIAKP